MRIVANAPDNEGIETWPLVVSSALVQRVAEHARQRGHSVSG